MADGWYLVRHFQHVHWRVLKWRGHPEPLLRKYRHGRRVLGYQRCPGAKLPTHQARSTPDRDGRGSVFTAGSASGAFFFVEFVAARRHNTYISVRLGASSPYQSAPSQQLCACCLATPKALHHRSHKVFRTIAAHKREPTRSICLAYLALHWVLINSLFTFHHRELLREHHPSLFTLSPPPGISFPTIRIVS